MNLAPPQCNPAMEHSFAYDSKVVDWDFWFISIGRNKKKKKGGTKTLISATSLSWQHLLYVFFFFLAYRYESDCNTQHDLPIESQRCKWSIKNTHILKTYYAKSHSVKGQRLYVICVVYIYIKSCHCVCGHHVKPIKIV
jgi:hypothetical protein